MANQEVTSEAGRSVSSYKQLADFPDTREIISGKFLIKIKQMIFEIIEIVTLRPMIWIGVQVTEKTAIRLAPVGEQFGRWIVLSCA